MVRYDIAALLSRFDVKVKGETELTGKLGTLLGERLLLSALTRYLSDAEGHEVRVLGDRPHRDDAEFQAGRKGVPRDIDAWLLLDEGHLAAVECKHWTSSSMNFRSVPEDSGAQADYAREEMWNWLVSDCFVPRKWNDVSKVALPLKPPDSMPSRDTADARRILAVWTPISKDGRSCMSSLATATLRGGQWIDIVVEVFSASMYLRDLLAGGMTHLEAGDEYLERVLSAISTVIAVPGSG